MVAASGSKQCKPMKHTLKFYAAEKEMIYRTELRLVFLDKQYSQRVFIKSIDKEVFQTLLAVFKSKGKARSSRSEVFHKKGVPGKFRKSQVFSCELCKIFKNTFFPSFSEKLKAEPVVRKSSVIKVFLEISINSQEKTCAILCFAAFRPATLLKQSLWRRCFPLNFANTFLRIHFFTEHLRWLLL